MAPEGLQLVSYCEVIVSCMLLAGGGLPEIWWKVVTANVDGCGLWTEAGGSCLSCVRFVYLYVAQLSTFTHVPYTQNCAKANVKFTLGSNRSIIYQSCWNEFSFSKQPTVFVSKQTSLQFLWVSECKYVCSICHIYFFPQVIPPSRQWDLPE